MKLLELTGIKKHEDKSLADFFSSLILQKKANIENGSFGFTVMPSDKRGYVWKVWNDDPGFDEYLRWAQANQSNPHALKIIRKKSTLPFTFKRPEWLDTTFHVIRVEFLKPLTRKSSHGDQVQAFYDVDDWATDVVRGKKVEDIEQLIADVKKKTKVDVPAQYIETHLMFKKNYDGMNDRHLDHDLTIDNVMCRDDGTFVITDPLYGVTDTVSAAQILNNEFEEYDDVPNDERKTKSGRRRA